MSQSIVITVPHKLGADAARKRIAERIEQLRAAYVDKLAHSEISWVGNNADMRIVALGQTVTAQLAVMEDNVRIEAQLPWLLAALGNKAKGFLTSHAKESLQIGYTPPKS
jgi:hypothetical protein